MPYPLCMTMTTIARPATSERLRSATMPQHRTAETRGFITALMSGELTLQDYVRYLAQLAYVYEALESRPVQSGQPEFIYDRRLHRFDAMCADLEALGAGDWRTTHPPLPETTAYVQRIRRLPLDSYARYLAHHYTRYLGDLSGGQAIASLVQRHYRASDDQVTFYRFEQLGNPVRYKRSYRAELDELELSEEETFDLVDEAQRAFELNTALFDALG